MAAIPRQLDTQIQIVTPENIAFGYRVAGPFQRLPAYLLDLLIQALLISLGTLAFVVLFGVASLPGLGLGLGMVLFFVIHWFYGGLFEALWNGQTPGKRMLRLRVLSADGQPINAWQAVLRNILRAVDALPAFYLGGASPLFLWQLGFLSTAMNERFARLGDLVCGTMVVVEEPPYRFGVVRIVEPEALELAAALPPGLHVSRGLALALSSYVLRRRSLPLARRIQIAAHVAEPLRIRYGLPPQTSYDLLLCALYHRVFFAESPESAPDLSDSVPVIPVAVSSAG